MEIQRRGFLRLISYSTLGAAAAAALGSAAGCGSSNGSIGLPGGGNNTGGGSTGGTTGGGTTGGGGGSTGGTGGTGGGGTTFEAVEATRAAIAGLVNALPSTSDFAARQRAVLDFLAARPEVAQSGPMDSGAWAVFKNGWPHVVVLNRPIGETPDDSPLPDDGRSRAAGAATPTGNRALFLTAMGSGFLSEGPRIRPALDAASYPVQSGAASLDAMRTLGSNPPSFLFLSTHGTAATLPFPRADGTTRNLTVFCLGTNTATTAAQDAALLSESQQGTVLSGTVATAIVSNALVMGNVYMITQEWVRKYWRFSRDSLVWVSACDSHGAGADVMVQACLAVGAGAYAGYTDTVETGQADRIQRFMIDRLIGANVLSPKEETPQRAFDYDKLLADMTKRIGNSFPVSDVNGNPTSRRVSLKITQNPTSQFGLLSPSIAYVLVDEVRGKAILKGSFGLETTDGKVFIDGQEAAVETWGDDEIRCTLADSGGGSAGDVQVVIRGRKSNVRRITRYTIRGTYQFRPDEEKPHVIEGGVVLQFRMDVGEYRQDPGKVFVRPTRTASAAHANSQTVLTAKGIYSESCGDASSRTETYSGEATLVPFDANHPLHGIGLLSYLKLDTINKTGALAFLFGLTGPNELPFKNSVTDCDGQEITVPIAPAPPVSTNNVMEFASPSDPENAPAIPLLAKTFDMSGDWGIPGGTTTDDLGLAKFTWIAAEVEFAPDPQAARSKK